MAAENQEDQVTLGDKRVETSNFDRYKGRKGVTDRLAILSVNLIRRYTYYYEGGNKKTTFIAPSDKATLEFVKKQLGEPQQRFGLTLFQYQTDEQGELITEEKLAGKVKIWNITESRYEDLTALHKKWPILDSGFEGPQFDFMAKCTEEQYQRMSFTPAPEAFWKKKQAWYDALKGKEAQAKAKVVMALGRQMTNAEIMDLLGGSTSSSPGSTDNAGDVDLSDIVEGG